MVSEGKSAAPPYGPTTGTIQALQLMRKATPPKVDGDFLRAHKIAPGNEYKVVGALRFLGLIDDNGTPMEKSRLLKTMGSTFTLALQEIVRSAYRELFHYLDVKKASREDVYNYFITESKLGTEMAAKAARFFITLCRMAQIELGNDAQDSSRAARGKGATNSRRRANSENGAQPKDNTPTIPLLLTLTPEMAKMDTDQLTELFRKLRTALNQSLER
jgi:hypothetical protein